MIIVPTLLVALIVAGAAIAYVTLTRKTRKKPSVKNQTTKRCPYRDCEWWITFKDLNDEVRNLYRKHLEIHKAVPRTRFEDVGRNWFLENELQLLENSAAPSTKSDL